MRRDPSHAFDKYDVHILNCSRRICYKPHRSILFQHGAFAFGPLISPIHVQDKEIRKESEENGRVDD